MVVLDDGLCGLVDDDVYSRHAVSFDTLYELRLVISIRFNVLHSVSRNLTIPPDPLAQFPSLFLTSVFALPAPTHQLVALQTLESRPKNCNGRAVAIAPFTLHLNPGVLADGAPVFGVKLGDSIHTLPASALNALPAKLELIMASEAFTALDSKRIFWKVEARSALGALPVAGITLHAVRDHGDLLASPAHSTLWVNVETISAREAPRHQTGRGSGGLALLAQGAVGVAITVKALR